MYVTCNSSATNTFALFRCLKILNLTNVSLEVAKTIWLQKALSYNCVIYLACGSISSSSMQKAEEARDVAEVGVALDYSTEIGRAHV